MVVNDLRLHGALGEGEMCTMGHEHLINKVTKSVY